MLQCLDEFGGESIFVAATNLEDELDTAIWRRFDTKMTYCMPTEEDRLKYMELLIGPELSESGLSQQAADLLAGCSFADIEQIVLKAKRKSIIEDCVLDYTNIENALSEYSPRIGHEQNKDLRDHLVQ